MLMYVRYVHTYILNIQRTKKHLKMNKEVGMLLPKKVKTSVVGKSTNYYEDIYIPPYNNTH